ncbi:torsin-1A-like isoform X2 [Trachinotus anak]|uniref:torsin-1A-like isoform X2 n=1 Tax=Trachinotus anak TaxID=443729 RepID=UPI0039F197D4
MKAVEIYLLLHLILTASVLVNTFDPITVTVGVISNLWQLFNTHERCDSEWISFNAEGLRADLESKLFGQHIASRVILKAVNGFMSDDNPQKPLVLSLHGRSGTGKNFSQLQQWIKGNATNCERSMFIFDEMDEMNPGLIDSIKSFLNHYKKLDGVSYRKAIFIFLSNAGGEVITETALDFWKEGRNRDEIKLIDLETSLSASAFNDINSGFWHSRLIDDNLVDFFIPFLPLEYRHVVQCAMAEMKAKGLEPDQDVAAELAKDLIYFPKSERVFSVQGCKTIEKRLYHYID